MNKEEEKRIKEALDMVKFLSLRKFEEKNSRESKKSIKEGDSLFVDQIHNVEMHARIFNMYSRSVAFALPNSPELAFAYGARAKFLMHMGKYVEALVDLDVVTTLPVDDETAVKYLCYKVKLTNLHMISLSSYYIWAQSNVYKIYNRFIFASSDRMPS